MKSNLTFQKFFYLLFFAFLVSCSGDEEAVATNPVQTAPSNRILKFYGADPSLTSPIVQNQRFTIAGGKVTHYDFGAWAGQGDIAYSGDKIAKITTNYLSPVYSKVEFFFEYDNNVLKSIKGVYTGGTVGKINILRVFYANNKVSRLIDSNYFDENDIINDDGAASRQYAFTYSGENVTEVVHSLGNYSGASGFVSSTHNPTVHTYEGYTDQKNPFSTFPFEFRIFLSSVLSSNYQLNSKNFPQKVIIKNPNSDITTMEAVFKSDSEGWITAQHEPNNPVAKAVCLYETY